MQSIRFDLVVPTYNRSRLLKKTLESVREARLPERMQLRVLVVDNNSRADEAQANARIVSELGDPRFQLIVEPRQGSSHARNAALAVADGDWIGFIDDDEELTEGWFEAAWAHLSKPEVGFIGGPYLPNWESKPPSWLPAAVGKYIAVIGWVELGDRVAEFGPGFDGMTMGGNIVVKREWFDRVGHYDTELGRKAEGLHTGGDHDMHDRLMAAGARGFYVPELAVRHFIPDSRLTKQYHRRWAFWHGLSDQRLDLINPKPVTYLAGMPRYILGKGARGAVRALKARLPGSREPAQAFSGELEAIETLGWIAGRLKGRQAPSARF